MHLTTKSRYGTRIVLDIALHERFGPVKMHEVASRLNLPLKYLEKIARDLRSGGFISSFRGPNGGYVLGVRPENVSVGNIVRHLEDDSEFIQCGEDRESCQHTAHCITRPIWLAARDAMYKKLDSIRISELVETGQPRNKSCKIPVPC